MKIMQLSHQSRVAFLLAVFSMAAKWQQTFFAYFNVHQLFSCEGQKKTR